MNLILLDGSSHLKITNGIRIIPGNRLTIWGQPNQTDELRVYSTMTNCAAINCGYGSTLVVNSGKVWASAGPDKGSDTEDQFTFCAGIGGADGESCGAVIINGGTVNAFGGGAGIGGGRNGIGGSVTINGGSVKACGGISRKTESGDVSSRFRRSGAGIGGGGAGLDNENGTDGGTVTITGGKVYAEGGHLGAGIGGGSNQSNGKITISGGEVTAVNAKTYRSGGHTYDNDNHSAAIGAGSRSGNLGGIIVSGGTVNARSFGYGAGIGGGSDGNSGYSGGRIVISGTNTVVTSASIYGAGIGSGGSGVGINDYFSPDGEINDRGSDITISNGAVFAVSAQAGAGIGGGNKLSGGSIEIKGGYVEAIGGSTDWSWIQQYGISGGNSPFDTSDEHFYSLIADIFLDFTFSHTYSGAGIGAGSGNHKGGNVNISGGIVVARSGSNDASAIGWGKTDSDSREETLAIYDYAKVTYGQLDGSGQVINQTVVQGTSSAKIEEKQEVSKNNAYAKIEPGDCEVTYILPSSGQTWKETVICGAALTVPAVVIADGEIIGWYSDADMTEEFDFNQPVHTDSVTIYGKVGIPLDVEIKWNGAQSDEIPDSVTVALQKKEYTDQGVKWVKKSEIQVTRADGYKGRLYIELPANSGGEYEPSDYRVREIDSRGYICFARRDDDALCDTSSTLYFFDAAAGESAFLPGYAVSGRKTVITNERNTTYYSVKKEWEIDLLGSDKPEYVKVQLQVRNDYEFKWEKVEELVLSADNNWSGNFSAVPDGEKHYRIREINSKGQTVHIDTDLDSVQIKTALDKLKDWKKYWEVDWSWDGLSKLLGVDVKRPEPTVVYKVSDANGSHNTKYYVKYDTQGNCTTITNIAVLDISIYKRWLMFGDAKKPKSVYLMLLWRDKDADNGVPYIPVMDVLYGDALTPLDLAGDSVKSLKEALKTVKTLTGYDIESKLSFGAAIGLAKKKDNILISYRVKFGVRKYSILGKERAYLGAELVTGLMGDAALVITGYELPGMIQPFEPRYVSVFGKAYKIPVLDEDWELTCNVINTWISIDPKDAVGGTKIWDDDGENDPQRPESVVVHVYAKQKDDSKREVIGSPVTVKKDDDWVWTLAIDKNDEAVKEENFAGEYIVEEEVPDGYTASYEGYDITNKKTGAKWVTVSGQKTWEDGNNAQLTRPSTIRITLFADGVKKDVQTVSKDSGWKWTFAGLPKYREGTQNEIVYTVTEDPVEGYRSEAKGFNVTNTCINMQDIEGEKTWADENNLHGKRPASIVIRLKADGSEVAFRTVTESDGWKWKFRDLPIRNKGKTIEYTISEDAVPDYTSEVDGYNVTNTYTPGQTQVNVTKVWNDSDNLDGIRPDSVIIRLLADGENTEKVLTLSESNGWKGSFTGLDIEKDGNTIEYTVEEEMTEVITGADTKTTYSVIYSGDAERGFTVTNIHTPDKTFTITYQLNGGQYQGKTDDIVETHSYGEIIDIHNAPEREYYAFCYWQGSNYYPGEKYRVTEDHTFTAIWRRDRIPPEDEDPPDDPPSSNPDDDPPGSDPEKEDPPGSDPEKDEPPGSKPDEPTPGTGENGMMLPLCIALMILSAMGYAAVISRRTFYQNHHK